MTSLNEQPVERMLTVDAEVEQIYRETRSSVCAYLLYLGVPDGKAQEVTQEVFLRLYETMRKGTHIENVRAWVYRVAHNLGLKVRSRERALRVVHPDWERMPHPATASPESALIDQQRHARVSAAMEELSPQQRHCLYLRSEGLRYREIADVMGISASSVNEFLRRAVARLSEVAQ